MMKVINKIKQRICKHEDVELKYRYDNVTHGTVFNNNVTNVRESCYKVCNFCGKETLQTIHYKGLSDLKDLKINEKPKPKKEIIKAENVGFKSYIDMVEDIKESSYSILKYNKVVFYSREEIDEMSIYGIVRMLRDKFKEWKHMDIETTIYEGKLKEEDIKTKHYKVFVDDIDLKLEHREMTLDEIRSAKSIFIIENKIKLRQNESLLWKLLHRRVCEVKIHN